MKQVSLTVWVKHGRETIAYRFLQDVPEFMLPDGRHAGPFKRGDLVSAGSLPSKVWSVLVHRGVVKAYSI